MMNTFHFHKYKLLLLAFFVLASCDDRLDIKPRQELDSGLVFTSPANLQSALYGAYSEIKGTFDAGRNLAGELYGGDFNIMSELLASDGNVAWGGTFSTYREAANKEITTTSTLVERNWVRAYNAINNVNNVLANLDVADDPGFRARIEGEARLIRAMMYFNLVRFWAKPWGSGTESGDPGVPLVLEPITTVEQAEKAGLLGRSTVADVYAQVIDDLTQAEALLADFGRNGTNLSTYAAAAMLARVYLQQSEWEKAAQAADRVISSGEFGLNPNPMAAFNNTANTSEDVFAIQQTTLSNAGASNGGLTTFYARLNGFGRGDMQVQPGFLDIFEEGDLRNGLQEDLPETATIVNVNKMYYLGVGGQNSGNIQCAKWGDHNLNIQVIRLAEMYLVRAEANFEGGASIGDSPLNDVNAIRERAGVAPLNAVTREDIRRERERELAFEGFRLHDKKRWKENVGELPWDAPSLVLPIPERELEVYDIEQNSGY